MKSREITHYSVPYTLTDRILKVRLTGVKVTVFDGESALARNQAQRLLASTGSPK